MRDWWNGGRDSRLGLFQRRSGERPERAGGQQEHSVVIEPGTAALRLLVAGLAEGEASVIGWSEAPGWTATETNVEALAVTCGQALAEAEAAARQVDGYMVLPDQILVGLPSSVLCGGAWSVETQRPRPDRPVEESEVEAILARALRLAVNRLRSGEEHPSDWYLVEASPVTVSVDGHGVTDPVGFRGETLSASVFAALAKLDVIQMWEQVARQLEFSTLTLCAAPLALAAGLPASNGILVDVGGATTDIIWCQAGRPMRVASVPVGGNGLTEALTKRWDVTVEQADSLKAAYSAGELEPAERELMQDVLWPALQVWLETIELELARLSQAGALPGQIFLLGGGSALPEMEDAVRSLAWSQRLYFARYPQVRRLYPADVPGVANRTDKGRKMGDVSALALLSWAAKQRVPPDRPTRLVSELSQ